MGRCVDTEKYSAEAADHTAMDFVRLVAANPIVPQCVTYRTEAEVDHFGGVFCHREMPHTLSPTPASFPFTGKLSVAVMMQIIILSIISPAFQLVETSDKSAGEEHQTC